MCKGGDDARAKAEAKARVKRHYGLSRDVTDRELEEEMANLRRKAAKGSLDDRQERLAVALGVL